MPNRGRFSALFFFSLDQDGNTANDNGVLLPPRMMGGGTLREPFNFTPMGVNPISPGSPHVRPMGVHRTCGGPDEIKKNTHPKNITALFRDRSGALTICQWVYVRDFPAGHVGMHVVNFAAEYHNLDAGADHLIGVGSHRPNNEGKMQWLFAVYATRAVQFHPRWGSSRFCPPACTH